MADIDDELFALAGGEDDAEEGEASSPAAASSPGHSSAGSAAMDESDSEAEDNNAVADGSLYPLDGLYIDQKDKARIAQMSEIDREQILSDRQQEKDRLKFQEDLKRRAQAAERDTVVSEKKRKADSADLDDNQRKSARPKTKATSTLEAYKQQREQRDELRKRQNDRRDRRRSRSADKGSSDVDAEGESEAEWDDAPKPAAREEPTATLMHFEAVRVNRAYFGDVCFYPGFDKAMIGTFVRVGVGASHGRTLYKMAQIKGFTQGKPYVFEGKNNKKVATDQYVIVQHGSVKKEYDFKFLSNGRFTEEDLETYKRSQTDQNLRVPGHDFLRQKFDDMKALDHMDWTDQAIRDKLDRQHRYDNLLAKEAPKEDPAKSQKSAAERLAEINKMNRRTNSEQIRKALIEERKAQLREREARQREARRKEDEAKAKLLKPIDDLFEGSDGSRAGTPAAPAKKANAGPKAEKKGIPTFRKKAMDDDIISSMDLGIEIDI